jgi:hypothetical protein
MNVFIGHIYPGRTLIQLKNFEIIYSKFILGYRKKNHGHVEIISLDKMSVCLIKTDFLQPHGHRSTAKVL